MNLASEPVTIEHVLDHFDHVARLVGVQHVAVGSDLDLVGNPNAVGGGGFRPQSQPNFDRYQYHEDADGRITVKGLDHPKRMFDLAEGLIRRGYRDADIALMLGGNAVRVLSQIWGGAAAGERAHHLGLRGGTRGSIRGAAREESASGPTRLTPPRPQVPAPLPARRLRESSGGR
jgi:hypothetical protein